MVKVQFFPVDISYETNLENKAIIQLFGRTLDSKKICVLDYDFNPYFYVTYKKDLSKIEDQISDIMLESDNEKHYVTETKQVSLKQGNKNINAIKITVNHPKSVSMIKKYIESKSKGIEVLEADILFIKRYLIDKNITPLILYEVEGDVIDRKDLNVDFTIKSQTLKLNDSEFFSNPKILAFDIEVYTSEKRYPAEEIDPIIMVAFSGNFGFKKVITWKKFKHTSEFIEFVDDELALIRRFNEIINYYNPDYITGYFTDGFDFPYIKKRAKKYQLRLNFKNSSLKISKRGNVSTAKIKGMPHLDIFKFIKNIMSGSLRLENYGLNSVALEILNEKKLDTKIDTIGVIWDERPEELEAFCKYNLQDADLALKICERILPNLNELVKLVGIPIFDVCRIGYSQLVESYLIKRSKEYNEVIASKPTYAVESARRMHTYKGAYVFNPEAGFYENLVVFDFQSLYPSILVTHNISPLTLTDKNGYETPEIESENGKKLKYRFLKEEGFIPAVIRDIIVRRARVKELLKQDKYNPVLEARSYALKTIMNATYGYFAFFGARWYSVECAEAITAFGRSYIQKVIKEAQDSGFKVIYSDTDSIFIALQKKTKVDSIEFLNQINEQLPGLMELELENFYPRAIFVMKKSEATGAKKKYALFSEDGRIKVRGFETIRRDWSQIAREVQKEVLELILRHNSPEKAFYYVKEVMHKIRSKEIDKEKMIIQTQLKKRIENYDLISPHVTVAKLMKERGIRVSIGSIINYIVTEGKGKIRDKAALPGEATNYDSDYYINNQIIPAVDKIFEAIGYNVDELLKEKEQSDLQSFFKK